MQKTSLFSIMILSLGMTCFWACSTKTVIIREVYPITQTNGIVRTNLASVNIASQERDDVLFSVEYINRNDLFKLAKMNNKSFTEDRTLPYLTVFALTIRNNSKDKIKFDLKNTLLKDTKGKTFPFLDDDTFKETYPNVFDQSTEYSFLFEPTIIGLTPKGNTPLFKGGTITAKSNVYALAIFPYIDEMSFKMSLLLPNIEYYDKEKVTKKRDILFEFYQTKKRAEVKRK